MEFTLIDIVVKKLIVILLTLTSGLSASAQWPEGAIVLYKDSVRQHGLVIHQEGFDLKFKNYGDTVRDMSFNYLDKHYEFKSLPIKPRFAVAGVEINPSFYEPQVYINTKADPTLYKVITNDSDNFHDEISNKVNKEVNIVYLIKISPVLERQEVRVCLPEPKIIEVFITTLTIPPFGGPVFSTGSTWQKGRGFEQGIY